MAKLIKTDIYVRHYDNWAGYLYYFSVCAAASTFIGMLYDQTMIGWFILSLVSTASFWAISRKIALGRVIKPKAESSRKPEVLNVVQSEKSYTISMSQRAARPKADPVIPRRYPMSEAEKDALIKENKKKGVIHL